VSQHDSPRGRPVCVVEGNAGDIESRGDQIVRLGGIMREGYNTLTNIVTSGLESSMEGKAVEALAEVSREVYTELDLAAGLYESVGPFVRDYGDTLGQVQSRMRSIVPAAEAAWNTYQSRLGDLVDAQNSPIVYPSGTEPSDDGSAREAAEQQHADGIGDAQVARDNAYAVWREQGVAFDEQYDTWEAAFETAVSGIRTETANGIQDDWRDDLDGFVAGAMQWLQVAGVVLAVLALVVGGPIVALLAAVVGILSLLGTIWQFSRGDANGLDLALAIIGVIPFGALGEAFSAFRAGGNGFASGFRSWMSITPASGNSRLWSDIVRNFADAGARWGSGITSGTAFFDTMRLSGQGVAGFDDLMSTLVTGQPNDLWPVIGDLGTMGEQAMYAFTTPGVLTQTFLTAGDALEIVFGPWD